MSDAIYVLRDTRSNLGANAMFWADSGSYTSSLAKAERFTKERALRQHRSRDTDQPLPLTLLQPMTYSTVDHQHLPSKDFKSAEHQMFVIQIEGKWDGNDIYFYNADSARNGESAHTTNLKCASAYTYTSAIHQARELINARVWPQDLLTAIARSVVRVKDIDMAVKRAQLDSLELLAATATEQE